MRETLDYELNKYNFSKHKFNGGDMRKVLGIIMVLALSGCSKGMVQHSFIKSYTVGEVETAYIGQPVIKIRDIYQEVNKDVNNKCFYAKPSNDFTLTGEYNKKLFNRKLNIKGSSKNIFSLGDKTKINGVEYSVFNIDDDNGNTYGLMVNNEGKIVVKTIYDDDHDSMFELNNAVLTPANTTMIATDKIAPCHESDDHLWVGDNNFELLYGGINNVTISMTYREYTWNDLARPSFFQNLVYETSAKEIRFKDFKIAVIESSNEKIVYKIIEDKLEDTVFSRDGKEFKSLEKTREKD